MTGPVGSTLWPAHGDRVSFRLGDSDLGQYLDPSAHDDVLTGVVVSVWSGDPPDVMVRVPDWASLHTVPVVKVSPAPDRMAVGAPLADGGPGWVLPTQPPGTFPPPLVVRCAVRWCSSALAMPPGTTPAERDGRLAAAGWRAEAPTVPVCPAGHADPWAAPAPPAWTRWLMAGLLNVFLLVVVVVLCWTTWDNPWPAAVFFGLVATVFWWAFVLRQWRRWLPATTRR